MQEIHSSIMNRSSICKFVMLTVQLNVEKILTLQLFPLPLKQQGLKQNKYNKYIPLC